jgi:methyl-accepting chemotaxis protein
MAVFLQLFSRLEDGMAALTEEIDAESKAVNASSTSGLNAFLIEGGLIALLVQGGLALWITRSIARPINACVVAMKRLADGDLTTEVVVKGHDELGNLGNAINTSITTLRQLVGSLTHPGRRVAALGLGQCAAHHGPGGGARTCPSIHRRSHPRRPR